MDQSNSISSLGQEMSKEDLQYLLGKANNHRDFVHPEPFKQCKWVVRDLPKNIFDDISSNQNSVMEKRMKDETGDPKSCINGKIKGLFFSPTVYYNTGEPLENSPFGNHRLKVRAEFFFSDDYNLYFADFYCKDHRGRRHNHFVTLVMARIGSEQDQFCQETLIKLDPYENQFFKKKRPSIIPFYSEICSCFVPEPEKPSPKIQDTKSKENSLKRPHEDDSELPDAKRTKLDEGTKAVVDEDDTAVCEESGSSKSEESESNVSKGCTITSHSQPFYEVYTTQKFSTCTTSRWMNG